MRNKNFIIIVIGQIISLFGNAVQRFSMSLYLLEFTGSTAAFSKILALSTIPYVLFAPLAGRLSDKVNRKKIMVYLDFLCFLIICAYAFVLFKGHDSQIIVGIVMFVLSVCAALYGPAVTSSIPQIVDEDNLTSANGIINAVGSLVNFAGPIIAGILYGIAGIKIIVIINAVSFLFSAVMEMFLNIPDTKQTEKSMETNFINNSFKDMKNIFIYLVKEKKVVFGIIVSYALCNIFIVPVLSIAAPYFINIKLNLSAQIYGIVEAVCVSGMFLGGFLISLKPKIFSIRKVHLTYLPMLAGIVVMAVLGFVQMNVYKMAAIFALCGMAVMFSLALSNVLTLTYTQKEIPSDMLGSVSAFSTAAATISVAPGQILFGYLIEGTMNMGMMFLLSAFANIGLLIFIRLNVRKI